MAKKLDVNACRRLAAAITEQAVEDLKSLQHCGALVLVDGFWEINRDFFKDGKKIQTYQTANDVFGLLCFFGSPLAGTLAVAGVNTSAAAVRSKLKIKPVENYAA